MATELKPIRAKADYKAALAEVERLWGARSGTPKGDRLDVLATLIDAYETRQFPMDPPDPIEAMQFRMEQQGLTPKGPRNDDRNTRVCRRGHEPQAQPFHRNDPASARATRHIRRDSDSPDPRERGGVNGEIDRSETEFPDVPGWRFSLTEVSMGVYRAEGFHPDGRSVSRTGHDVPLLISETTEDARALPEKA